MKCFPKEKKSVVRYRHIQHQWREKLNHNKKVVMTNYVCIGPIPSDGSAITTYLLIVWTALLAWSCHCQTL